MDKPKLLARIINNPRAVRFFELVVIVETFGFRRRRVRASHHIFTHESVPELVNLQEVHGQAKPYQIGQFLKIVERYDLRLGGDE